MLTVTRENTILFNEEYLQYQDVLTSIENKLKHTIPSLGFDSDDLYDAMEYSTDRVSLFRFLKDSGFSEDNAVERLLDTIQWRKTEKIGRMTYQSVSPEFFENPFAYFYKQDMLGRPVAVIQMRHFPKFREKNKSLSFFMQPFACLVMEIARQITRDLTRKNEAENVNPALVSQISIVIDIANAPFVPVDSSLMQGLKGIVNDRFPSFVGSVYIMNFGWMYQGIWQVVKLVLSEQAKARVCFCNSNEMKQVIHPDDLLKVLGGNDEYEWSVETDATIRSYATEERFQSIQPIQIIQPVQPLSPIMSPILTNRISRSSSVSSVESSMFFDAPEFLPSRNSIPFDIIQSNYNSSSPSLYGTPGTLTPLDSYLANRQNQVAVRLPSEPRYFLTGFRMGDSFLTSFFRFKKTNTQTLDGHELADRLNQLVSSEEFQTRDQDFLDDGFIILKSGQGQTIHFPHMLPNDHPQSQYMNNPIKHQLMRIEQKIVRLSRRLFHLSFSYHGAVYWVVLYLFLRGPVESTLKKALARLMAGTTQQHIAYTTAGISATVAAALSATLSNSLQSNNNNNNLSNNKYRP